MWQMPQELDEKPCGIATGIPTHGFARNVFEIHIRFTRGGEPDAGQDLRIVVRSGARYLRTLSGQMCWVGADRSTNGST